MMRLRAVIIAAILLALGGWGAFSYVRSREPGSFAVWRWRAAEPFDSLRARAWREQRLHFLCQPIVGPHQLCQLRSPGLPITGIPGALRVLVDSAGVAAAISFRPLIDSSRVRGQARRSAREWKADVETITAAWGAQAASLPEYARMRDRTTRSTWQSPGGRFIASMRDRDDMPVDLTVADGRAIARIAAAAPIGPLALARAGFPGEEFSPLVDAAALGLATAMLRPSAAADVGPVVEAPSTVPLCDPVPPDMVLPGAAARQLHGNEIIAALSDVVPRVYPGARIVVGARLYFVSASGAAEELHVMYDDDRGDDLLAIALYFRRRGEAALSAVERFAPISAQCRAPAELLLVRRRGAGPSDVQRLAIDDEAPWSRITSVEFESAAGQRARLHVTYETGYATESWLGTIAWAAAIATDPPRTVTRTPIQYGKRLPGEGGESAGVFTIKRHSADTLEVWATDPLIDVLRTKVLRMPAGRGGRFSGFRLLDGL